MSDAEDAIRQAFNCCSYNWDAGPEEHARSAEERDEAITTFRAETVAAERARIKAAVEGLPMMDMVAGPWPEASVVSAVLVPAVLAIIDAEKGDKLGDKPVS